MAVTSVATYKRKWSYTVFADGDGGTTGQSGVTEVIRENTVARGGGIRNWRRVIAEGGNATTGLTGVLWRIEQTPAALQHELQYKHTTPPIGSRKVTLEGNILALSIPEFGTPTLELSEVHANNQALTRYYSNLASTVSSFKGAVLSGELRESLSMIRHPARALRRGIGDYLSFLRKNARQKAKHKRASFVRSTWLEYSFGWRPLINDIDGAIQAFYKSQWVRPIFKMVKGTGRDETKILNDLGGYHDVGAGHFLTYQHEAKEDVYVKYFGVTHSLGNGVRDSHSYGFAPWEFVPTVWELIPYSFLVDYFTNIGNIVSSWSYRSINPTWTAKTTRRQYAFLCTKARVIWDPVLSDSDYFHHASGSPGSAAYWVTSVGRAPNVVLGLPSLEVRCPGNWSQWANIVALTSQLGSTRKALAR